jgi:hypothetical protein
LVSDVRVSQDIAGDIHRVDVERTALVDGPVEGMEDAVIEEGLAPHESVHILVDKPGWVEVRTSAASWRLLVLSESYHSGWKVTVDGSPATAHRVYGDLLGCPIAPGVHQIEWRFQPHSVYWGTVVAVGSGLLMFITLSLCLAPRASVAR